MKTTFAVSSLSLVLLGACSGDEPAPITDDPAESTSGGPTSGGPGNPGEIPPPPPVDPGCDNSKLPSEDQCVLHESFGVFVSANTGDDANGNGSRIAPFKSFGKALTTAKSTGRRVYACAEVYSESILLQESVSVFGALTCAGGEWAAAQVHAVVESPTSPAALAEGISGTTRIEGIDLIAPAAVEPGESSIALIVNESPGLQFVRSKIVAQDGAAGTDGRRLAGYTLEGGDGQASAPAGACTARTCASPTNYVCSSARTAEGGVGVCRRGNTTIAANPGGTGGEPVAGERAELNVLQSHSLYNRAPDCSSGYYSPKDGTPVPATPETARGASALYNFRSNSRTPLTISPAEAAAVGAAGDNGENGASFGQLSLAGYLPADGTAGAQGALGQGGGGGRALMAVMPVAGGGQPGPGFASGVGGSGGGAGGCPGVAGTAGTGGGASIAVVAVGASFTLDQTEVIVGSGGVGGKGSTGVAPTNGGAPGSTSDGGSDAAGAAGGAGGAPGFSGHGGSGPAIGIAWRGQQPTVLESSSIKLGPAAAGQPELTSAYGTVVPASDPGLAVESYEF